MLQDKRSRETEQIHTLSHSIHATAHAAHHVPLQPAGEQHWRHRTDLAKPAIPIRMIDNVSLLPAARRRLPRALAWPLPHLSGILFAVPENIGLHSHILD